MENSVHGAWAAGNGDQEIRMGMANDRFLPLFTTTGLRTLVERKKTVSRCGMECKLNLVVHRQYHGL